MDLRTKKTQRSIREAFLQLRGKKPLERITVKELTELAEISKATFYLHYQDIYDLSDRLQQEVIEATMQQILQPEAFLANPTDFMQELVSAFAAQRPVIQVLFSGHQSAVFPARIEEAFKQYFSQHVPQLNQDVTVQTYLTYEVYGAYYAFLRNVEQFGRDATLQALHNLSLGLTQSPTLKQSIAEAKR